MIYYIIKHAENHRHCIGDVTVMKMSFDMKDVLLIPVLIFLSSTASTSQGTVLADQTLERTMHVAADKNQFRHFIHTHQLTNHV